MSLNEKRSKGIPILGPLLQTKAADLVPPSKGFVNRFKRRCAIKFKKCNGEAGDANEEGKRSVWLLTFQIFYLSTSVTIIIWRVGLFWREIPLGSLCFKDPVCFSDLPKHV